MNSLTKKVQLIYTRENDPHISPEFVISDIRDCKLLKWIVRLRAVFSKLSTTRRIWSNPDSRREHQGYKKYTKEIEREREIFHERYRYIIITVYLFTKTKNNKKNVAIQKKTQSWHEGERYAKGPRAHSFFSSRVLYFFFFLVRDFFLGWRRIQFKWICRLRSGSPFLMS